MSDEANAAVMDVGAAPQSRLAEFWHYYSVNKGAVVGLVVFIAIVLVAIFAPVLAPYHYMERFKDSLLVPPVWHENGNSLFLLGTDDLGRDMLSRIIYGAQYSLLIGFLVVVLSLTVGVLLGLLAGYFQGWVDTVIMRFMDLILAFPSLLLALGLVAIFDERGIKGPLIAIAVVLQPHFARLTRAAVMAEKNREYVVSAKVAGAGNMWLMFVTILPNCLAPLIVQATMSFSNAILEIAALGFLGYGVPPPIPEWGALLATARKFMSTASWTVTYPGLAILITVLCINLIGDGLRDAFDPKLKRS